jgi:hypothetical protein
MRGKFAVRKGDWVFIDASTGDDNQEPDWLKQDRGYCAHDLPGELYNLEDDISEAKNLYADKPGIVRDLKELLEQQKSSGRSMAHA